MAETLPPDPIGPSLPEISESVAATILDPKNQEKLRKNARESALEQTDDSLKYLKAAGPAALEWAMTKLIDWTSAPGPVGDALARAAMKTLLVEGGASEQEGARIGKELIQRLAGDGRALAPGYEGAAGIVGLILSESIEAWLRGVIVEAASGFSVGGFKLLGEVETFAQLQDVVEGMLGGGRTVRQVLGPIVHATAVTPATWQTNKTYRPELLGAAAVIEAFLDGRYTGAQLSEELARQGWSDERINILVHNARPKVSTGAAVEAFLTGQWTAGQLMDALARQGYSAEHINLLVSNARKRLSIGDVTELLERGAIGRAQAVTRAAELGYDENTAATIFELSAAQRRERYMNPVVPDAIAAYLDGAISERELEEHAQTGTATRDDARYIVEASRIRRELRGRSLSASDERRLVLKQIRTVADYRRALEREGYDFESITALELELRFDLDARSDLESARRAADEAKAREAEEKAAAAAARAAELEARKALPTLTEYKRAYVRGHIDRNAFASAIVREKVAITPADLELLLADADEARADWLAAQAKAAEAAKRREAPGLSLAQLEAATLAGVLTLEEYDAAVAAAGYPDDDRRVLTALVGAKLEDRMEARRRRDEAAAAAEVKSISLPAFERAVRLGLRSRADYAALLVELGLPELSRALILDLLDATLAQDAAARATREAKEAEAAAERAREEEERARREAAGLPAPKTAGISLAQRRRAVVAGTLPIEEYERALIALAWPAEDRAIELELLLLEAEEAAAARARRDQAEADAEARRAREEEERRTAQEAPPEAPEAPMLSLSQLERALRLGLIPITAFRAALYARGYAEEDLEIITALVVASIPDTREGQKRETEIARELAEKGIAFSDLKAAARRGLASPADYAAELEARGYGADDVALLRQLLEEELGLDLAGLRTKIRKVLETVEGAPALEAIEGALSEGELDAIGVRDVLVSFGVPEDTALVFGRLLVTLAPEE